MPHGMNTVDSEYHTRIRVDSCDGHSDRRKIIDTNYIIKVSFPTTAEKDTCGKKSKIVDTAKGVCRSISPVKKSESD